MALSSGTRLGPYEIVSPLGAGGMGEVYRARDTRLDRTVAIKVLPSHLSADPERRQRFEREARAVSSLNHPHICTLHDIGHQEGIDFLVMEYLEGETLDHRLTKGPLPAEQVLRYGVEIADALYKAHRQGIIHRDLKPGNIMLTKSGAKLLDFGLAKLRQPESGAVLANLSALPTEGGRTLTGEGTILGTLQYMAPEQLEGKEADARTDIFGFGTVVYEMATGKKAFEGKSQASLIAAILDSEPPPISTLQPMTPPALDHVVRKCLAKDPDDRWQTAHDLAGELQWISEGGSQAGVPATVVARRKSRARFGWIAAGVLLLPLLGALTLAVIYLRDVPQQARVIRFLVSPPEKVTFGPNDLPVISPDGQHLAFTGSTQEGKSLLWIRPLDLLTAQPLAGTDGAYYPFWSPDSRSIAFSTAQGKLKKIPASGGPPETICDVSGFASGAWNRDGTIIFSQGFQGPLYHVSETGGETRPLTTLDKSRQETSHQWPCFLPDDHRFLYLASSAQANGIYIGSLDSKENKFLFNADSGAKYAPPGFLLFVREGTLMTQPFDVKKLQTSGDAFPVAEQVAQTRGRVGAFSVSDKGVLVYRSPSLSNSQLVWFDRAGKRVDSAGEPGMYSQIALSPDDRRVAVQSTDPKSRTTNIWLLELSSNIFSRFTFGSTIDMDPIWSPDGRQIVFGSRRKGKWDLFRKQVGGGDEELLFESDNAKFSEDWSNDGRFIVFISAQGNAANAFYTLPLFGERKPTLVLQTPFEKDEPHLSPNGQWVAYGSNESGRWEIYVASFPDFTEKRQVSNAGGGQPLWRKDGKELFYLSLDGNLMAVDVKMALTLETGVPKTLFQTGIRADPVLNHYCVTSDGRRFLVLLPKEEVAPPITVVVNWAAGLKK